MPGTVTEQDGYTQDLGGLVRGEVAADDPRISGTWGQRNNVHLATSLEPEEGMVGIVNGTARIGSDAGAWVGTWTGFGGQPGGEEWYVLEGEGAYEGLTTIFRYRGEDNSMQGSSCRRSYRQRRTCYPSPLASRPRGTTRASALPEAGFFLRRGVLYSVEDRVEGRLDPSRADRATFGPAGVSVQVLEP